MKPALAQMSVDELIARFVEIALAQEQALLYRERRTFSRLYKEMDQVDNELRDRGTEARLALASLYTHPNFQVRVKAAKRSLAVAPAAARQVLESIRDSRHMPQALEAGMSLWNLDTGVYKPT